jgi:hypothetical protein
MKIQALNEEMNDARSMPPEVNPIKLMELINSYTGRQAPKKDGKMKVYPEMLKKTKERKNQFR